MKFSVSSAWENKDGYDVVVIGAGHAGCEAALASARLGLRTIIFTVSVDSIAMMPCNPNIGGTSKGHLVREIDALGGEMGKNIDKTFIQSKMLNMSKGPAVHSLRAQADKNSYSNTMRQVLENTPNLEVRQMEIAKILWEDINSISLNIENQNNNSNVADNSTKIDDKINSVSDYSTSTDIDSKNINKKKITGVMSVSGTIYPCKAVILCTGTYLNGRCLYGDIIEHTGPNGLKAANYLTDSLNEMGIKTRRFKTGTPARVDSRSLDFSKMEEQKGDEYITPFSFATDRKSIQKDQISCWLTYTNDETHTVIRDNINRSPLFTGVIEGTGPRYCPSIEDKVVKFPDKIRHQLFVEPEGLHTNEMYLAGMSSSLPEDVQYALYRTIPGLENCRIVRNAYAIEYDCIDGRSLKPTLEFNDVDGLFSAGQFNGSSGYEEAAAQGLIAGINAARKLNGDSSIIIDRSMGYIGVLIDDIVTKESHEPYRMMTSRAEYRLLLRQDNADQRLTPLGYEIGLISKDRYDRLLYKEDLIANEIKRLEKVHVGPTKDVMEILDKYNSTELKSGSTLAELIKRPELAYEYFEKVDVDRPSFPEDLKEEVIEQINIELKYDGYIKRQERQVNQFKKMEEKIIPEWIDYNLIESLRIEAKQKLTSIHPLTVGQASRISGVSPADISVLLVYLEKHRNYTK